MNFSTWTQFTDSALNLLDQYQIPRPLIFLVFVLGAILISKATPNFVRFIINRSFSGSGQVNRLYQDFVEPLKKEFRVTGSFILISFSLVWLDEHPGLYKLTQPLIALGVTISLAWLFSRLFRQLVRIYGISIVRKLGIEVDDFILIVETVVNVLIGFFAVVAFAQSQKIPLTALLAGVSIGATAVAFAAKSTLEQLLGTIVLYLDRPFIAGEYIRLPDGLYGRVESIGLRSTKIRTAAKSTLFIMPNNTLANLGIENVTRGKKVMVLLYLDFNRYLQEREQALVQQVVKESTDALFGIDPGSTSIVLLNDENSHQNTRARVTFFILGSNENSIQLRKRLLELANQKVTKKLMEFGIEFTLQEPNIYVESPVTI